MLSERVGTKPHEILAASHDDLLQATRLGGMLPAARARRLREMALIAMNDFDGDVRRALRLPLAQAKRSRIN